MLKILELFGGIGACSKALERLGIEYEIADYVEIDKYAVSSYNAMHHTNFEPQDICKWDKDIEADLIMHGSPCQDFSLAGLQAGGDEGSGTRSSLMYETIRIVNKLKPKYVIWENVKNMISKKHIHNFNNYIERMGELGYTSYYQVLNAKDYGIPQNRERIFTISIRNDIDISYVFPEKKELKLKLKDMLEDNVDEKYYLSDSMIEYLEYGKYNASKLTTIKIKNATKKGYLEAEEGDSINLQRPTSTTRRGRVQKEVAATLDTQCEQGVVVNNEVKIETTYKEYTNFYTIPRGSDGKLINGSYNRVWKEEKQVGTINLTKIQEIGKKDNENNLKIRKLTPCECWRLMGFDDSDFDKASKVNSNTQLYKQAGNSIVVNVLEAILYNLLVEPTTKEENIIEGQTDIYEFIND